MPPIPWKALGVAVTVGIVVVFLAWWAGPSLFGITGVGERQVVPATVTLPADCPNPNARETVQFELDGEVQNGTLSGCGHRQDEKIQIAVPADATTTPEGLLKVHLASTEPGTGDLRRPVGLALLVLSCTGGAMYAFLVARGPRRPVAVA